MLATTRLITITITIIIIIIIVIIIIIIIIKMINSESYGCYVNSPQRGGGGLSHSQQAILEMGQIMSNSYSIDQ